MKKIFKNTHNTTVEFQTLFLIVNLPVYYFYMNADQHYLIWYILAQSSWIKCKFDGIKYTMLQCMFYKSWILR